MEQEADNQEDAILQNIASNMMDSATNLVNEFMAGITI